MFISTLLIIPWIIFGFKNADKKTIGLNQTKKSIVTLLIVEIVYFLILIIFLGKSNPNIAGRGDFAWTYMFIYEKSIFPVQFISESINGNWGDIIDRKYKIVYLLATLFIDYLILLILSPKAIQRLNRK